MHRLSRCTFLWTALVLALSLLCASSLAAQTRLSDKDLEQRIKNLNSDAKQFQSSFNKAISRSGIRKTSQEKDSKTLADKFTKSTKSLYEYFKKSRKSDPYLQNTLDYAKQLERLQSSVQLDSTTSSLWTKVRLQLNDVANAFHVSVQ